MARRGWSSSNFFRYASGIVTSPPLTIAAWAKSSISGSVQTIAGVFQSGSSANSYLALGMVAANTVFATSADNAGNSATANTSTTFATNTWFHGCAVFAAVNDRRVYLNGAGKGTNATSRTPSGINRTSVGYFDGGAGNSPFAPAGTGDIAEVAMWNIALTDADVLCLSRGIHPFLVRPDSLIGYWPLIGSYSPEINLVSNTSVLTMQGTVTQSAHCRIFNPSNRGPQKFTTAAAAAFAPGIAHRLIAAANNIQLYSLGSISQPAEPPFVFVPQAWPASTRTSIPPKSTGERLGPLSAPFVFVPQAWPSASQTAVPPRTTGERLGPLSAPFVFVPQGWQANSGSVQSPRTASSRTGPERPPFDFYPLAWPVKSGSTIALRTDAKEVPWPHYVAETFSPREWNVSVRVSAPIETRSGVAWHVPPPLPTPASLGIPEWAATISMRSGFRVSPSDLVREWTGLMVARWEVEGRHPQEFVRGRVDRQSVDNPKPEAPDVFLSPGDVTGDDL